jgi:hypothetical protein
MSDVFSAVAVSARGYLRDAAVTAAYHLGLFAALPATVEELARAVGAAPRRLRALLDVLVLEGALGRDGARLVAATLPPRPAASPPHGWGRLAEVLRRDRPLPADDDEARFHDHLFTAGAAAARALAPRLALGDGALLDAGGGAGAYTAAALAEFPSARATLVDRAPIVRLAAARLAPFADRARLVAGDLFSVALDGGFRAALLANVLHLYDAEHAAALIARVAAAVAPGGLIVVKDLRVEADRSGPAAGLLFALNMALYTDGGDVHAPDALVAWLRAAGLTDVAAEPLGDDAVVALGRRP